MSKMLATVTLSLTPSTTITRFVRVVKHLKVADVISGMSFLCHENATINCAEKRVVFLNNDFVQCNDKMRRANCLVLSPTKFAELLRKSTRYKKGQRAHFWVGVIQPSRKTSIFQNDEIASISTGLDESFTLRVKELLSSFPDLTNPWTALPPVRGEFDHHIELNVKGLTGCHRQRKRNWYVNAKSIFQ